MVGYLLYIGALSVKITLLSATSINISWELVELPLETTVISYTIFYSNTNTNCFTDFNVTSDIDSTETMYALTDLEEDANYSITVGATLCGLGDIRGESIIATTLPAG